MSLGVPPTQSRQDPPPLPTAIFNSLTSHLQGCEKKKPLRGFLSAMGSITFFNMEEVKIPRRWNEGVNPIFDRDELRDSIRMREEMDEMYGIVDTDMQASQDYLELNPPPPPGIKMDKVVTHTPTTTATCAKEDTWKNLSTDFQPDSTHQNLKTTEKDSKKRTDKNRKTGPGSSSSKKYDKISTKMKKRESDPRVKQKDKSRFSVPPTHISRRRVSSTTTKKQDDKKKSYLRSSFRKSSRNDKSSSRVSRPHSTYTRKSHEIELRILHVMWETNDYPVVFGIEKQKLVQVMFNYFIKIGRGAELLKVKNDKEGRHSWLFYASERDARKALNLIDGAHPNQRVFLYYQMKMQKTWKLPYNVELSTKTHWYEDDYDTDNNSGQDNWPLLC